MAKTMSSSTTARPPDLGPGQRLQSFGEEKAETEMKEAEQEEKQVTEKAVKAERTEKAEDKVKEEQAEREKKAEEKKAEADKKVMEAAVGHEFCMQCPVWGRKRFPRFFGFAPPRARHNFFMPCLV